MSRTLADILLAQPRYGDYLHLPVIDEAKDALKLPLRNHMTREEVDHNRGICDRLILSDEFAKATIDHFDDLDHESRSILVERAAPPLPMCWIEYPPAGAPSESPWPHKMGSALFIKDGIITLFMRCPPMHGGPASMLPYAWASLADIQDEWLRNPDSECGNVVSISKAMQELRSDVEQTMNSCGTVLQNSIAYFSAITNPRSATAKRIIPSEKNAAERARARRRFQQGRPMFSYNHVDLVVPQTCIYRGDVVESRSLAGKRGHMVIGHWRLISGAAEPFFTWVDGHERGDRELGLIIKERHVQLQEETLRSGFIVPSGMGSTGERRPAVRPANESPPATSSQELENSKMFYNRFYNGIYRVLKWFKKS